MLELAHQSARVVQLRATLRASPDMRLERRGAEAHLAVEQQVDLIW